MAVSNRRRELATAANSDNLQVGNKKRNHFLIFFSLGDLANAGSHKPYQSSLDVSDEWRIFISRDESLHEPASEVRTSGGTRLGHQQEIILSICIGTFNRSRWLRCSLWKWLQQIKNASGQVELIVSDNASSDDTKKVIAEARGWGEFVFLASEQNVGFVGNYEKLANAARGRHIWMVGDDDLPLPGAISRIISAITLNPEAHLIFANYSSWVPMQAPGLDIDFSTIAARVGHSGKTDRKVDRIGELIEGDFACLTNIYTSVWRGDDARLAYKTNGVTYPPFSNLEVQVPHAVFIAKHLATKNGYFLAEPCILASFTAAWLPEFGTIFLAQWLPQIAELFVEAGIEEKFIAKHRRHYLDCSLGAFFRVIRYRRFSHLKYFDFWNFFQRNYRLSYFYLWPTFKLKILIKRIWTQMISNENQQRREKMVSRNQ